MNGLIDVLGWTVARMELQAAIASVDHIVTDSLRNDYSVVSIRFMAHAVDPDLAFAAINAEELIGILVTFAMQVREVY